MKSIERMIMDINISKLLQRDSGYVELIRNLTKHLPLSGRSRVHFLDLVEAVERTS